MPALSTRQPPTLPKRQRTGAVQNLADFCDPRFMDSRPYDRALGPLTFAVYGSHLPLLRLPWNHVLGRDGFHSVPRIPGVARPPKSPKAKTRPTRSSLRIASKPSSITREIMGRGGTRPYPLEDSALKVIRTLSHPVAVPFQQTAKFNYRNAYGIEACCLGNGSWEVSSGITRSSFGLIRGAGFDILPVWTDTRPGWVRFRAASCPASNL